MICVLCINPFPKALFKIGLLPLAFLLPFFSGTSWAQNQRPEEESEISEPAPLTIPLGPDVVKVNAKEQHKTSKHDFRAKGNVVVRYQDMLLKADEVWGNDETQEIEGEGNVYFEQGKQYVYGSRFRMNLQTKTGTFYVVTGKAEPGFSFEAREVDKLGEDKYRIKHGFVTACEGEVPKWSFSVSDALLLVNQHANLKHTFFRIKRIPIFFSPYLVVPTDETKRQSGFLIPSTGNSTTRGRSVSDAFYLTLGRSADLLASAEYFSLRGMAGGLEFRARPSKRSSIFAEGFFAIDRLGQGGQSARVIADNQFENGFRAVANVDVVSSQVFRQVYGDTFATIVRPDEVSSGFLTRNFSTDSFNVFGERRLTLFPRKPVVTRTFPSFNLFGHNRQLKDWPVYFSYDTAMDALSRTDAQLSTPPVVQRFDFYPRVTLALKKFAGVSFTPSVGLRETFYSDRFEPESPAGIAPRNLVRSALDFQGQLSGPALQKIFDFGGNRYKHVIEPEVTYRYINGIDELNQTIRFDERDIMSDTNEVEYSIVNRFFSQRATSDGGSTTSEFMSIRVGQKYFFDPTFGGALIPGRRNVFYPLNTLSAFAYADGYRRFSPIISRIRFTPAQRYAVDFRMDYDQQVRRLRASSITGSVYYSNSFVALTYYNTANLPPTQFPSEQIRAIVGYGNSLRRGFNAALGINYDFRSNTMQHNISQVAYNWDCCGVALELRKFNFGLRKETQLRFSFSLKNIGSFGNLRRQERLF
jgi:LPS-assembly protein